MSIRVALHHLTEYRYNRRVGIGPQLIRLRPAPHCRTPVHSYSLKVEPADHFINWQQDPQGNHVARLVFPEPARALRIEVDLIAEMTAINPFDFFVEEYADEFPFKYESWLDKELRPFLEFVEVGPKFHEFLESIDRRKRKIVEFLVELNQTIRDRVSYIVRMEPGVQTPEESLASGRGSCRDSAWLLVQVLRRLGLAARFASGYLIQLVADQESLDGPPGPKTDFTDLHAWTEVYIPGAGWIGLDPTSGLFASEGHLPLACTPDPFSAAPISGGVEPCEVEFSFDMSLQRIAEAPRVTKPYRPEQWQAIDELGHEVDRRLAAGDVRLTMGGEPTFISIDDMDGAEWNTAALGPDKERLSAALMDRLRRRLAPGGLLHRGQGKWYPGESLPRWAMACYWRVDGEPIWRDQSLLADPSADYGLGLEDAERFLHRLAAELNVEGDWITPAYEDVFHYMWKEQRLPINVSPTDSKLKDPEERTRLARVFERGVSVPAGYVIPLRRQWPQARPPWTTGPWPVRPDRMFLLPGDSPIGLRLPLDSLPWSRSPMGVIPRPRDPLEDREPLPQHEELHAARRDVDAEVQAKKSYEKRLEQTKEEERKISPNQIVRTALCIEPRGGRLHIFMPPVDYLEDYLDLIAAIERTAAALHRPVVIEGYPPPHDHRIQNLKITPDPGVIEVNVQPAADWEELTTNTIALYEDARQSRLGTDKFDLDGKHTGTGGGNHIVLGASTPGDSPFLRRPDLLRSMLSYWLNHPSLSYLFSGRFVGPTCQAPRVDEGRRDFLYELEIAFSLTPPAGQTCAPWLVDRLYRHLLTDLTGNTHRAEFCIDKLYSPDSSSGRLGLVELRSLEMPPHAEMSLTQQLLIRSLVAAFWEQPYEQAPIDWGVTLHDRFLLPHFVWADFGDVLADLRRRGFDWRNEWFAPHFEFRFPVIGAITREGVTLELRSAIEPWHVLGEEAAGGGTARFVDSSIERIQVKASGLAPDRYVVSCNGRRVPLVPTGATGEYVAGVRYRAWQPPSCLQPTIPTHTPLVFDVIDLWSGRSIGGCTYHVAHPSGRNYETFPVNASEAEARRNSRFFSMGHTPGPMQAPVAERNPVFPLTLDLRRAIQPA